MPEVPFSSIPDAPAEYNAATVLSRLMEGLGFRYHWATEGLPEEALTYRPEPSCRSIGETLDHIHNLAAMVEHSVTGEVYVRSEVDLGDVDVRLATLEAIERVTQRLRAANPADMSEWKIRFLTGEDEIEFPFWNSINGMMTDAIYHLGQVVAYRRAAGAPIDGNVNVFLGTRDA